MRLIKWLPLVAVACASAAVAQTPTQTPRAGYTVTVTNASSGSISVVDNGVTVCRTGPNTRCMFDMVDGANDFVILGPNGTPSEMGRMRIDAPTSRNPPPSYRVEDCDFTSDGCDF